MKKPLPDKKTTPGQHQNRLLWGILEGISDKTNRVSGPGVAVGLFWSQVQGPGFHCRAKSLLRALKRYIYPPRGGLFKARFQNKPTTGPKPLGGVVFYCAGYGGGFIDFPHYEPVPPYKDRSSGLTTTEHQAPSAPLHIKKT